MIIMVIKWYVCGFNLQSLIFRISLNSHVNVHLFVCVCVFYFNEEPVGDRTWS